MARLSPPPLAALGMPPLPACCRLLPLPLRLGPAGGCRPGLVRAGRGAGVMSACLASYTLRRSGTGSGGGARCSRGRLVGLRVLLVGEGLGRERGAPKLPARLCEGPGSCTHSCGVKDELGPNTRLMAGWPVVHEGACREPLEPLEDAAAPNATATQLALWLLAGCTQRKARQHGLPWRAVASHAARQLTKGDARAGRVLCSAPAAEAPEAEPEGVTDPEAPPDVAVTGLALVEASPMSRPLDGVSMPPRFRCMPCAESARFPVGPAQAIMHPQNQKLHSTSNAFKEIVPGGARLHSA